MLDITGKNYTGTMMNKSYMLILVFSIILLTETKAGDHWHIGAQYQYSLPAGALSAWFSPAHESFALMAGYGDPDNWNYSIRLESMLFDKPNREKLTYNDLHLRLNILSASLEGRYSFITWPPLRPFLLWEAGLYRWQAERGSYLIDDPATGSETLVPERNQSEWSWGFSAGIGTDIAVSGPLTINVGMRYRLIIGELWPALALDLEGVSVFQMAIINAGLTWYL